MREKIVQSIPDVLSIVIEELKVQDTVVGMVVPSQTHKEILMLCNLLDSDLTVHYRDSYLSSKTSGSKLILRRSARDFACTQLSASAIESKASLEDKKFIKSRLRALVGSYLYIEFE